MVVVDRSGRDRRFGETDFWTRRKVKNRREGTWRSSWTSARAWRSKTRRLIASKRREQGRENS